ncbi:hypothetical protein B9Q17_17130 [Marinobacter vinifirmus]|uniref:EamA family transporter n=1 Tax=Marinobacter vinifirmus TaxID=355591 RepID=A0A7Z1DVE0_9GAMM|nr:hypothetical protein B9Q17_17130 [Marinobacter vinifirmus]
MLCYAAFILTNRLIHERVHVLTRSGYQMLAGALCMLPLMLMQDEAIQAGQWGWLAAAGVLPGSGFPAISQFQVPMKFQSGMTPA